MVPVSRTWSNSSRRSHSAWGVAEGLSVDRPTCGLDHAEIAWEGDRYWIEDPSPTGTFVNDVRLTDKPVVLIPGMRIRLGETMLEVRPRQQSTLLRVVGGMAALFIGLSRTTLPAVHLGRIHAESGLVQTSEPGRRCAVQRDAGTHVVHRSAGIDHRELKIDDVTDYDDDGVDELGELARRPSW